jgi:hypothetical protein
MNVLVKYSELSHFLGISGPESCVITVYAVAPDAPPLTFITKFHATVDTSRLIATASARFTLRASTFASAKVTVECVSEVLASDFDPETGDPKIEGFDGFSQSRDALFIMLPISVFIIILGFKGIKHTCR